MYLPLLRVRNGHPARVFGRARETRANVLTASTAVLSEISAAGTKGPSRRFFRGALRSSPLLVPPPELCKEKPRLPARGFSFISLRFESFGTLPHRLRFCLGESPFSMDETAFGDCISLGSRFVPGQKLSPTSRDLRYLLGASERLLRPAIIVWRAPVPEPADDRFGGGSSRCKAVNSQPN